MKYKHLNRARERSLRPDVTYDHWVCAGRHCTHGVTNHGSHRPDVFGPILLSRLGVIR